MARKMFKQQVVYLIAYRISLDGSAAALQGFE